jgi:hypothetical protein
MWDKQYSQGGLSSAEEDLRFVQKNAVSFPVLSL